MRPTRCAKALLGLAVAGLCPSLGPSLASAQTPPTLTTLLRQGDTIIGVGAVEGISYVGITDSKLWSAQVDTSFADTARDICLLRNGFVTLREGMPLFSPPGASLGEFASLSLSNDGDMALVLKLDTSPAPEGAFFNLVPVALKDTIINSPDLGPDSDWDRFEVVKLNNRNELFILGDVDNKAISGNREDALIRYRLDDLGNILETTVLATKGMFLDVLGVPINTLGTSPSEHSLAINERGDFIALVNGVGRNVLMLNMETILAEEGRASPVPTRNWMTLQLTKVSINDRGDFVFTGALDGQSFLIVKNGQKFALAGEVIPTLSSFPLANGSPAPVVLTNAGDVFWRGAGNSGGGQVDEAFLRNYQPLIQRNRTVVNGNLVLAINGEENAFAVSPEGRFFIGRVTLQSAGTTALYIDFGLVKELPGCRGNPARLTRVSGEARVGQQLQLGMDGAQAVGALPVVLFSRQPARPGSACGVNTQYGEVLISSSIVGAFVLPVWNGTDPSLLTINIPIDVGLVDAKFYGQGVFRNSTQPLSLSLSNGMLIEIGAP
jgi:hypothetical protein